MVVTSHISNVIESLADRALLRENGEFSEGEKDRVPPAQVPSREPLLVILDEPTGSMDPITRSCTPATRERRRSSSSATTWTSSATSATGSPSCTTTISSGSGPSRRCSIISSMEARGEALLT